MTLRFGQTIRRGTSVIAVLLLLSCGSDPVAPGDRDGATAIELVSDPGDYIGQGETYSYSQANARITVFRVNSGISITVEGDEDWTGSFRPRDVTTRPEVGRFEDAVISWAWSTMSPSRWSS